MEKRLIERIKKLDNVELLREIRDGMYGREVAKEIISRISQGDLSITSEHLQAILNLKAKSQKQQKEIAKLKEEATTIALQKGLLNEGLFMTILREVESKALLERITKVYQQIIGDIPNHVLTRIIQRVPTEREWAARTLKKQRPSTNDLITAMDWLEEEQLQIELLQELFKRRLSKEDVVWLVSSTPQNTANLVWEKCHKFIQRLSRDDFAEMLRYTESEKIKKETISILLDREDLELSHIKEIVEAIETLEVEKHILCRVMDLLNSMAEREAKRLKEKENEDGDYFENLETIGSLKRKLKEKNLSRNNARTGLKILKLGD